MPDEVQDTEEQSSALATEEETQDETAVVDDTEQTEEIGFNKTQLHQIGSALGRIVKNQFEENYSPAQQQQQVEQPQQQGVMEKFSSDIQDEIFTDPVSAIRKVVGVLDNAKTNLTKSQTVATDKAITAFSEDPVYKDCFTEAQKIARKAVVEGFPPDAAARLGFSEAKAKHLEPNTDATNLGMIGGGKQTKTTKQPTVPAQFKVQMRKDIDKGLFKDESEWIESLSPKVRATYNI